MRKSLVRLRLTMKKQRKLHSSFIPGHTGSNAVVMIIITAHNDASLFTFQCQPDVTLSITLAPNMVASYITTGNKRKMTVPNKATALRGSMDACPNTTLGMTAQTVSEGYPYKRAPCQSAESQTAPMNRGDVCFLVQLEKT